MVNTKFPPLCDGRGIKRRAFDQHKNKGNIEFCRGSEKNNDFQPPFPAILQTSTTRQHSTQQIESGHENKYALKWKKKKNSQIQHRDKTILRSTKNQSTLKTKPRTLLPRSAPIRRHYTQKKKFNTFAIVRHTKKLLYLSIVPSQACQQINLPLLPPNALLNQNRELQVEGQPKAQRLPSNRRLATSSPFLP